MIARQEHISGAVGVHVAYTPDGGPVKVEVVKSSGSAFLDGYVADFVRRNWRYYGKGATVANTVIEYSAQ